MLTVLLSEVAVDWLKHAFITKFNHIRPSVYERYTDVLCRDLGVQNTGQMDGMESRSRVGSGAVDNDGSTTPLPGTPGFGEQSFNSNERRRRRTSSTMRKHHYVDQSPVVSRRLGFASLPLAILAVLIGSQSLGMIIDNYSSGSSSPSSFSSFSSSSSRLTLSLRGYELELQVPDWDWKELVEYASRVGPWVVLGFVAWLW